MIERILGAIRSAESDGLLETYDESVLTGFSGKKLIGSLQRLARQWSPSGNGCYLEIGVFQGLTLLSVAAANPGLPCYGIDNFAYFDQQGTNLGLVLERRAKLEASNAHVINLDYEDALEDLSANIAGRKIGVFFVDGPHDYRSQLMCLELAIPNLHEHCVIVVDDCNYRHVRQANRDFLVTHPDYALVFEAYTASHPGNMAESAIEEARAGWWNGVNVIARDPGRRIVRAYPPTSRSRAEFENDHIIHSVDVAPHVTQAIRIAQVLDGRNWIRLARAIGRLERDLRSTREKRRGLFRNSNTYSQALPKSRYCALTETAPQ